MGRLVGNRYFKLPHLYLSHSFGVTPLEFRLGFGIRILDSLGYRMALFA